MRPGEQQVNPAASAQPQPEDAQPKDAQPKDAQPKDLVPAIGGEIADGEPAAADESSGPASPEEEEDDEYEPLWQGFRGTT
jgi:hypothetical protein